MWPLSGLSPMNAKRAWIVVSGVSLLVVIVLTARMASLPTADLLALARFGATRILVGHTIVPTITPLFDGKVIAVQVYPKREADGVHFESLLIRGEQLFRATPDGATQPLR